MSQSCPSFETMNFSSTLPAWLSEALRDRIHSTAASKKNRDCLFDKSHRYCEFHEARMDCQCPIPNFGVRPCTSSCFPLSSRLTLDEAAHSGSN